MSVENQLIDKRPKNSGEQKKLRENGCYGSKRARKLKPGICDGGVVGKAIINNLPDTPALIEWM